MPGPSRGSMSGQRRSKLRSTTFRRPPHAAKTTRLPMAHCHHAGFGEPSRFARARLQASAKATEDRHAENEPGDVCSLGHAAHRAEPIATH
jgi:hypothetical protein